VLASHQITQNVTSVRVIENGFITSPASATELLSDPSSNVLAAVLEQTAEVGEGRLLAIGDADMFVASSLSIYPDNMTLAENIADWALGPQYELSGHVDLADYVGDTTGIPLTIELYDGDQLLETAAAVLDASGDYTALVSHAGEVAVRGKAPAWLAVKQLGINISGPTIVHWVFAINGDANNDNRVDLPDINHILVNFGASAPNAADLNGDGLVGLEDLALSLGRFGSVGD
jgi:hypothetical protein